MTLATGASEHTPHTIAPTPEPERGVQDATRAIELDPEHAMGYGHRTIAYTQLPTPEWSKALADMDRHIELFEGHDPEAYRLRARIHDSLGNHDEAERDRGLARWPAAPTATRTDRVASFTNGIGCP